jgi:hypothetical protein
MNNDKETFAGYIGNAALYVKDTPQEKQNEPVAWTWFSSVENKSPYTQMTGYTTECWSWNKPDESVKVDEGTLMPLYATPQTKQLSEKLVSEMAQSFGVEKRLIRLIEAKIIGEYK